MKSKAIIIGAVLLGAVSSAASAQNPLNVPGADTPDEAVYLPGRNALLAIKAALWCQLHDIDVLAVATLKSNPFDDASASFFHHLGLALSAMPTRPLPDLCSGPTTAGPCGWHSQVSQPMSRWPRMIARLAAC